LGAFNTLKSNVNSNKAYRENQCYVVAAAQVGQHNEKRSSYGHTIICDPWGTIVYLLANQSSHK